MRTRWITPIAATALGFAWTVISVAEDQTLHYVESESTLELTVPAGGVWLVIPLNGFERIRPITSGAPGPRSFNVVDREDQVEIFGAFDSVSVYPGFRQYWAVLGGGPKAMELEEAPEPQSVKLTRPGRPPVESCRR